MISIKLFFSIVQKKVLKQKSNLSSNKKQHIPYLFLKRKHSNYTRFKNKNKKYISFDFSTIFIINKSFNSFLNTYRYIIFKTL